METAKKRKRNGALKNETGSDDDCNGRANGNKKSSKKTKSQCNKCKGELEKVKCFSGHWKKSEKESVVIRNPKLLPSCNNDSKKHQEPPDLKLTCFSVYDEHGHLCPFDTGLIETGVSVYFSGYLNSIINENPTIASGILAHRLGPIDEWWITGFDSGEKVVVGFTTDYASYYLIEASEEYREIYEIFFEKIKLSKIVIEFLLSNSVEKPSYRELIEHIKESGYSDAENTLFTYADFVYGQIVNYDKACPKEELDEPPLVLYPCIKTLVKVTGVTGSSKVWSKAVTTKLVREVFETFFPDQIESKKDDGKVKKKRCGVCGNCQTPNCGKCNNCKDMIQFGGTGGLKKSCDKRQCNNVENESVEEDEGGNDNEDDDDDEESNKTYTTKEKIRNFSKKLIYNVHWLDESDRKYKGRNTYSSAFVGDDVVNVDDFIMIKSKDGDNKPLYIARVVYMFDESPKKKYMFHGHLFSWGNDTILGETAHPKELFVVDDCADLPLGAFVRKTKVEYKKSAEDWFSLGGSSSFELPPDDGDFFYTKRFEGSRFVDVDVKKELEIDECGSCRRKKEEEMKETPVVKNNVILWRNQEYRIGTGVFLEPDSCRIFKFDSSFNKTKNDNKENEYNEDMYPEFYRKREENPKGSNHDTPDPFIIGKIEDIHQQFEDIRIDVRVYFRPENVPYNVFTYKFKDLNLVYYTEKVINVPFEKVEGKCRLVYRNSLHKKFNTVNWFKTKPFIFYYEYMYDIDRREVKEVPLEAQNDNGNDKFNANEACVKLKKPLKCMDVFAGCGGLSKGLHQAGIVTTKWAIEIDKNIANAFKKNFPDCEMFIEDCNALLKKILNGNEKRMPRKGEVEMMVGGPPCQGFSEMNRFNANEYSSFKNSLVVTFLSYCEYYRPKFFIFENVRNFVSFKRGMILKLTIRCLLAIGYQVTFGILQAGHYGLPQCRRRFILMASAPGYPLPKYPEPLHVFSKRGCQLSFVIDKYRYYNDVLWEDSAPYRTITVYDAISDLPEITNGWSKLEIPYDDEPITHYQRFMRKKHKNDILLKDHICKEMSPLVEARIIHIPTYEGADWRDLPNIKVLLRDGIVTEKLKYPYRLRRQDDEDPNRGVCRCAEGKTCNQSDRQNNTLIPWCLPHTADRHNNWAGLYGRLEWGDYFGTTVTSPEPMGKQGRVIHPNQNRVVSVRECARSQGFCDGFQLVGGILEKYRQVGNAVPPPLGAAIGREILKAFLIKQSKINH